MNKRFTRSAVAGSRHIRLSGGVRGLFAFALVALVGMLFAAAQAPATAAPQDSSSGGLLAAQGKLTPPPDAAGKLSAEARNSRISTENALPGTDEWANIGNYDISKLSAYPGATSVNAGGQISFYVKGTTGTTLSARLYRLGYYQNHGARLIATYSNINLPAQPNCTRESATGLVRCPWSQTFSIATNSAWISGVYLIRMDSSDGYRFFNHFVVRNDSYNSDIVVPLADKTFQAYNDYGDESLYVSRNNEGRIRAYKVSFDRPYRGGAGTGAFFTYDFDMIRWLEASGYDVSYISDVDTATNSTILSSHKVVLTMGHPEYWTWTERDNMDNALAAGKNLIFASANESYWNVRLESSSVGSNRIIVCYKDENLDPVKTAPNVTVEFHNPLLNRPENKLVGVGYQSYHDDAEYRGVWQQSGPLNRWYYDCTGFQAGDVVNNIVGDEWDAVRNNGQTPPGLETLTNGIVYSQLGEPYIHNASIYTSTNGAKVFAAASIHIAWGLIDHSYPNQVFQSYVLSNDADHRIEQLFANVIDNFAGYWNGSPRTCSAAQGYYDIGVRPTRTALPAPNAQGTPTLTSTPIPPTNTPTGGSISSAPVQWTNPVNVAVSGNTITKNGGVAYAFDAGAISGQQINSGDGYVEATVSSLDTYTMFGLSNGDTGQGIAEIKFAAYLAGGILKVYESDNEMGNFGAVAVGDKIRVAVDGGSVKYYRNGSLIYTSSRAPSYPLLVDSSLADPGASISNAMIGINSGGNGPTLTPTRTATATNTAAPATNTPTGGATCNPVQWIAPVNVSINGGTITKNGGVAYAFDAGAISAQQITSGDGYVEATVDSLDTYRMFGFSSTNPDAGVASIRFAAYLAGDVLKVYESDNLMGTFGALAIGDKVRVAVEGGVVKYYRNGTLAYTSSAAVSYPLFVDASIADPNGTIANAVICTGNGGSNPTATQTSAVPTLTPTRTSTATVTATATNTATGPTLSPTRTATATSGGATCNPVAWTAPVNVAVNGGTITKNGGIAYAWDAGAISNQLIASGDGYVEVAIDSIDTYRIIGLSNGNTGAGYSEIKFGAYLAGDVLKVFESDNLVGSFGALAVGDKVRVAVEGGVVKYYRNGALVYTSTAAVSYPLLIDSSIADPGGQLVNVTICTGSGAAPTNTAVPATSTAVPPTNTAIPPTNTATATATATAGGSALKVQYFTTTTGSINNSPHPRFRLINTGSSTVSLSNVKIRYWYTRDGNQAQTFWCDYATIGCANISGSFTSLSAPAANADTYLEIGFGSRAGTLAPGANISEIQTRFNKIDFTNYNQSNDYSFDPTKTNYGDSTRITVYYNGTLVWGAAPSVAPTNTTVPTITRTATRTSTVTAIRTATRTATATNTPRPTSSCVNVTWTALVKTSASGNDLRKSTIGYDWNAGAVSVQSIQSGDGEARAQAASLLDNFFVGLSYGNTDAGYADIDYAIYARDYLTLEIRERGIKKATVYGRSSGDVLRVAVVGGVVKYYRNNTLLYTSSVRPTYPLLIDSSIYGSGNRIDNAVLCGYDLRQTALSSILVDPLPMAGTPVEFGDVHESDYFNTPVQYLARNGIISGYADGTFKPFANTTRGQLAKIITLAENWAITTSGGPHFSDVSTSNPFYQYIETAFAKQVISGYADGTFRWGNPVTRGQLSKIIVLAQEWEQITPAAAHFTDVPVGSTFYSFVETAFNRGIITGYGDGRFGVGANATRGQIAKIVYNALGAP